MVSQGVFTEASIDLPRPWTHLEMIWRRDACCLPPPARPGFAAASRPPPRAVLVAATASTAPARKEVLSAQPGGEGSHNLAHGSFSIRHRCCELLPSLDVLLVCGGAHRGTLRASRFLSFAT